MASRAAFEVKTAASRTLETAVNIIWKKTLNALELTQKLIRSCLHLSATEQLDRSTVLLGGFPEFNSLTITTLITEMEEVLDCEIADVEISGENFETVGSLADFVAGKMAQP